VIFPVSPADVPRCWQQASKELERAFALSDVDTAQAHYQLLLDDKEQLWRIHAKAWAVTRVVAAKDGRAFEFVALAGHGLNDWKREFFLQAEQWAKRHGCTSAVFTGRRGWAKALPDYSPVRITMKKEL
jgi:hypothetical protein